MATYCADCGVKLPAEASVPAHGEPAGFWIRALALLIDNAVIWVAVWILQKRLGIEDPRENAPLAEVLAALVPSMLIQFSTNAVYDTVMVGTWGATLGKMLFGLKIVRNSSGDRLTYGLSFMRWFTQLFSMIPLGLGYLWVAFAPSKRAWHDYFCDTRVVRVKRRR